MAGNSRIRDVARLAGVSTATVSHVINGTRRVNEDTRGRVLAAAATLHYHPSAIARSLRTKSTGVLGVLVSDITNPFFTGIVRGIEDIANANGYSVMVCNTDEDSEKENSYLSVLLAKRVDGLIIAPTGIRSPLLEAALAMGTPLVLIDRSVKGMDLPIVKVDNEDASFRLVSHLIQDGHTRIGIINGLPSVPTSWERYAGYERALRTHGLQPDERLSKIGSGRREQSQQAALELLTAPHRPSAIFAINNLSTLGTLLALRAMNLRCPEDVAVVGIDDHDWAPAFVPSLTVIRQPVYQMGAEAARQVIGLARGERTEMSCTILPTELIVRSSCTVNGHADGANSARLEST